MKLVGRNNDGTGERMEVLELEKDTHPYFMGAQVMYVTACDKSNTPETALIVLRNKYMHNVRNAEKQPLESCARETSKPSERVHGCTSVCS